MKRDYNKKAIEAIINDKLEIIAQTETDYYTREFEGKDYSATITLLVTVGGSTLPETYMNPAEFDAWVDYFEITEIYMTNKLGEDVELTDNDKFRIEQSLNVIV